MKLSLSSNYLAAAALAVTLPQATAIPAASRAGVLYTLNNDPANASIVAMSLSGNGTIMSSVQTPTGGRGLSGVTGVGQPNVGSLFGSDSVIVDGNYLFTINAGSNTLSLFYISPANPMQPVLIGSPADTLGTFPMSVTYSSKLKTACVLNGGAIGGVTCFSVNRKTGLTALDTAPRSIAAGLNQTDPPTGPFSTTSDIMFNPSSSALIASIKGSPILVPIAPGFIYAWPVVGGLVSTTPTVTSLPSVVLDFSLSFPGNDFELLITDPALGADFLDLTSNLTISLARPVNITYQKAACWSYYEPKRNLIFVTDAAQANVTVLNPVDGSIAGTIDYDPSVVGGFDSVVVGSSFYVLTHTATVVNIDIAGYKMNKTAAQVQNFVPLPSSSNGTAPTLQGMAAYTPSY